MRTVLRFDIFLQLGTLLGMLSFVSAIQAESRVYTFDPARSELVVQLFKAGIGGPLAHDHVVSATQYTGQIQVDLADPTRSVITVAVQTTALQADDPALRQKYKLTKPLSEKDRQEIQAHMQAPDQLDVGRYPTIQFRSTQIARQAEGQYTVTGDLTMRAVTQSVTFPVQGELQAGLLHGWGSFRLLQSRFGYKPYSAFLGAIRNQDEVVLHFDIVAVP
jgi:polyisoprenoid-binding protein YceI